MKTLKLLKVLLALFQSSILMETAVKIKRRLRPGRGAMKELGKIFQSKEVSLETKAKTVQTGGAQSLC